jgi:hypothetical protein
VPDASSTHFTRAKIVEALQTLGDELTSRGVRGQLFIVGGAAIALAYATSAYRVSSKWLFRLRG